MVITDDNFASIVGAWRVMKRPPRDPQESRLTLRFIGLIVWQGLLLTGVTLLAFGIGMRWHETETRACARQPR
jgi:magnesium-transporting ATPase (P-type)